MLTLLMLILCWLPLLGQYRPRHTSTQPHPPRKNRMHQNSRLTISRRAAASGSDLISRVSLLVLSLKSLTALSNTPFIRFTWHRCREKHRQKDTFGFDGRVRWHRREGEEPRRKSRQAWSIEIPHKKKTNVRHLRQVLLSQNFSFLVASWPNSCFQKALKLALAVLSKALLGLKWPLTSIEFETAGEPKH